MEAATEAARVALEERGGGSNACTSRLPKTVASVISDLARFMLPHWGNLPSDCKAASMDRLQHPAFKAAWVIFEEMQGFDANCDERKFQGDMHFHLRCGT